MDTSKINHYVTLGARDHHWYAETEELIVWLYGAAQLVFVARLLAATSINTSLKSNVGLFRKAKFEIDNNLPFSNYLPVMLLNLNYVRTGVPFSGRKIDSFARAITGDAQAVVVDTWILRAFAMGRAYRGRTMSASNYEYTLIEDYIRTRAYAKDIEPRQLCSMIWSGVRQYYSGERLSRYDLVLLQQEYNMFTI